MTAVFVCVCVCEWSEREREIDKGGVGGWGETNINKERTEISKDINSQRRENERFPVQVYRCYMSTVKSEIIRVFL